MARTVTIQKTLFSFDELSDRAKENARDWWRSCEASEFDPDSTIEDAQNVAKILGIEFAQKAVPLMGGGTRYKPTIYYSGFSSQGDGACFEGLYSYAKGAAKAIREYAPKDETLHQIADDLQHAQRKAFYGLTARMKHSGRYYHAYYMTVDVYHDTNENRLNGDLESDLVEAMRDFANWIYNQLEKEYDFRMSDENVDSSILANECEFTEDGTPN